MDKIFIIEDDPERIKWFQQNLKHCDLTIAENVTEAVDNFKPPYKLIFLDHDLSRRQYVSSDDKNTGYEFLKYILGYHDFSQTNWVIHSHNSVGVRNMEVFLMKYVKNNTINKIPFGNLVDGWNSSQIAICGKRKYE